MDRRTIEEFYQVNPKYIEELYFLQVEMLKLQKHISDKNLRMALLFEGRDTAGKGRGDFPLFSISQSPYLPDHCSWQAYQKGKGAVVFSAIYQTATQCRRDHFLRPQLVQPGCS